MTQNRKETKGMCQKHTSKERMRERERERERMKDKMWNVLPLQHSPLLQRNQKKKDIIYEQDPLLQKLHLYFYLYMDKPAHCKNWSKKNM
jgi:hypothetical protein